MLERLQSVIVQVRDFEAGRRDFGGLLGYRPGWLGEDATTGERIARYPLTHTMLELRGPAVGGADGPRLREAVASTSGERADESVEGLCGLRIEVGPRGREEPGPPLPELLAEAERALRDKAEIRREVGAPGWPDQAWRGMTLDPRRSRGIPIELVHVDARPYAVQASPAAAQYPPGSFVQGLDHVVLLSPDLESSRSLYQDELGIRLALDRSFEARGVRLLFFRLGGVTIEIGGALGSEPRTEKSDRFGGLAWRVEDVDAARARLAQDGFDVSAVRNGHKPGTRVSTVRAPVHQVPTLLIEPA